MTPNFDPGKRHASDSESILARIDGGKSESKYQRDEIAYSQGDPADSVFYVQIGRVKVTVVSEEGKVPSGKWLEFGVARSPVT